MYNPVSKSRPDHLKIACDALLEVLPPATGSAWLGPEHRYWAGEESAILTPWGAAGDGQPGHVHHRVHR